MKNSSEHQLRECAQHELCSVCCVPLQDAHGGLSVFDKAHSAVVVPLVLDGHAADLHHHVPQLLGCTPTLFRTRELFARRSQKLAELSGGNRADEFNKGKPQRASFSVVMESKFTMSN